MTELTERVFHTFDSANEEDNASPDWQSGQISQHHQMAMSKRIQLPQLHTVLQHSWVHLMMGAMPTRGPLSTKGGELVRLG